MELNEMRHNHELTIAEIRQSVENEKKKSIDELRIKLESEKKEAICKLYQRYSRNSCSYLFSGNKEETVVCELRKRGCFLLLLEYILL